MTIHTIQDNDLISLPAKEFLLNYDPYMREEHLTSHVIESGIDDKYWVGRYAYQHNYGVWKFYPYCHPYKTLAGAHKKLLQVLSWR